MGAGGYDSVVHRLCAKSKGILAADESVSTITARFKRTNIPQAEDSQTRRRYRELLFNHLELSQNISGVILNEETVDQCDHTGQLFPQLLASRNIIPGVKLDQGKVARPGFRPPQSITWGLDGLEERIRNLVRRSDGTLGFGKWRQVVDIGTNLPEWELVESALDDMAQYAAICQAEGIVPITEPEILMDGDHSIDKCAEVTRKTLEILYDGLRRHRVNLANTILKPNMVVGGKGQTSRTSKGDAAQHADAPDEVARQTLDVLENHVPKQVPGIAFLSGGQTPDQATSNLRAIAIEAQRRGVAWRISFSFGRALQEGAMIAWKGSDSNIEVAHRALLDAARANGGASEGR